MLNSFAKTTFVLVLAWLLGLLLTTLGGFGPCGPTSSVSGIGMWMLLILTPAAGLSFVATLIVAITEISNGTLRRNTADMEQS
jgi:hypothetical protein